MVSAILIASIIFAAIAVALGAAYSAGVLDPVIEHIGIMLFKAKAEGEKKKLEAQGLKEGEDFMAGELKGNQQADEVKKGLGSMGDGRLGF